MVDSGARGLDLSSWWPLLEAIGPHGETARRSRRSATPARLPQTRDTGNLCVG